MQTRVGDVLIICLSQKRNGLYSQREKKKLDNVAYRIDEPPAAAHFQPLSLLSASDVSCLANTKHFGVSHSQKQYSIKAPCRPVITNSLSVGWTLFCTMSDKWLLWTNQSAFMDKICCSLRIFVLYNDDKHQNTYFRFGQIYRKHSCKMSHFDTEAHIKCL